MFTPLESYESYLSGDVSFMKLGIQFPIQKCPNVTQPPTCRLFGWPPHIWSRETCLQLSFDVDFYIIWKLRVSAFWQCFIYDSRDPTSNLKVSKRDPTPRLLSVGVRSLKNGRPFGWPPHIWSRETCLQLFLDVEFYTIGKLRVSSFWWSFIYEDGYPISH